MVETTVLLRIFGIRNSTISLVIEVILGNISIYKDITTILVLLYSGRLQLVISDLNPETEF